MMGDGGGFWNLTSSKADSSLSPNQLHEGFNLLRDPRPVGPQILLEADAAKERDDEAREGIIVVAMSTRCGQIADQQVMGVRHVRRHKVARLGREVRKLAHGVDRKAPLLSPTPIAGLEKALNVVPAQRLLRQGTAGLQVVEVLPHAGDKQVFLVFELRIEAGFAHACSLFEVLNACLGKTMFPKDGNRLVENVLPGEQFPSSHDRIIGQFSA
jgi:hypothetical protein